jgi:hypothetical protein
MLLFMFFFEPYDIISSLPRILYASGGIDARANFFAEAKTHMRNNIMIFFKNHDIINKN